MPTGIDPSLTRCHSRHWLYIYEVPAPQNSKSSTPTPGHQSARDEESSEMGEAGRNTHTIRTKLSDAGQS